MVSIGDFHHFVFSNVKVLTEETDWCQGHPRAFTLHVGLFANWTPNVVSVQYHLSAWIMHRIHPNRWNRFFSRPFWLRAVGGVQIEMERLSRLSLQVYFRPQISQEKGLIWYKTFFWSLPLKVVLPLHPQIFRFWSSQPFLPKQDQGALEVFIFIITVNHCIWRSARWIKLSSKGTRRYGAQHSTWHGCDETSGRVTQLHQDNGEPGCSSCSSSKRSWSSSWSRVTPTAGSCQQVWLPRFLRRGPNHTFSRQAPNAGSSINACFASHKLDHKFHPCSSCLSSQISSHWTCQIWQRWPYNYPDLTCLFLLVSMETLCNFCHLFFLQPVRGLTRGRIQFCQALRWMSILNMTWN